MMSAAGAEACESKSGRSVQAGALYQSGISVSQEAYQGGRYRLRGTHGGDSERKER